MRIVNMVWYVAMLVIQLVVKQSVRFGKKLVKQLDRTSPGRGTAADGLGIIYSFEAEVLKRQPVAAVHGRKPSTGILLPFAPKQTTQPRSRSEEWQIWRENNRMLFRSSA